MGRQIFRTPICVDWKASDPGYALVEHLAALLPAVTGKASHKLTEALALGEMAGNIQSIGLLSLSCHF